MEVNDFGREYHPDLHIPLEEFHEKITHYLVHYQEYTSVEVERLLDAFISEEDTIGLYAEGMFANPMSLVQLADRLQLPMRSFAAVFPQQFETMERFFFKRE